MRKQATLIFNGKYKTVEDGDNICISDGNEMVVVSVDVLDDDSEGEFKNGDEVEVSDDGRNWEHAFYVEINPIYKDHHVAIMEDGTYAYSYKYCRHTRKEYTLKECADALGVPVEKFRIKDE